MLTTTSQKSVASSYRRAGAGDAAERDFGKHAGLAQMHRAWRELHAMVHEAERAIARIEICRTHLRAAIDDLASALDRKISPQEWQFCPECNSGPGEPHSLHCSLEHGPELEPER